MLIERIQQGVAGLLRVDDQQGVQPRGDLRRLGVDRNDLVQALEFFHEVPRRRRPLRRHAEVHGRLAAHDGQRGQQAQARPPFPRGLEDGADDLVLKLILVDGRKERQHRFPGAGHHRQPEVNPAVLRQQVLSLARDPVALGGFLGVGIRLGVVGFQHHPAVAERDEFLQQIGHAVAVVFDRRRQVGDAAGIVELQDHGAVEFAQHPRRAVGQRIEPVLRDILAQAHLAEQEIRRDQNAQEERDAGRALQPLGGH